LSNFLGAGQFSEPFLKSFSKFFFWINNHMSKYTKFAELARFEALRRFEKAARTDEDFHNLTRMYDKFDEKADTMRDLYRRSMTAYAGIAPQYKIMLTGEKPIIRWDFPSLLQIIHFLLTLALTDEYKPLRLCKACDSVFYAQDARQFSVLVSARIATMLLRADGGRITQIQTEILKEHNKADESFFAIISFTEIFSILSL
jgi:hypothetical protein